MDAHDLRAGRGKGAVRVVVAQVALIHEGQELQVRKGADVLGLYALLLHPLAVEGDVGVHAVDGLLQPLELNALQRLAVDGFHGAIPVHRHNLQMWFRKNACIFARGIRSLRPSDAAGSGYQKRFLRNRFSRRTCRRCGFKMRGLRPPQTPRGNVLGGVLCSLEGMLPERGAFRRCSRSQRRGGCSPGSARARRRAARPARAPCQSAVGGPGRRGARR